MRDCVYDAEAPAVILLPQTVLMPPRPSKKKNAGASKTVSGNARDTSAPMSAAGRNALMEAMLSGLVDDDTSMGERASMENVMGEFADLIGGGGDDADMYDRLVQMDARNGHAPPPGYVPGMGHPDEQRARQQCPASAPRPTSAGASRPAPGAPRGGAGFNIKTQLTSPSRRCHKCGETKVAEQLSRCARCGNAYYCDAACQRADWKAHKPNCRAPLLFCPVGDDEGAFGANEFAWVTVMPCGQNMKPYGMLIPAEEFAAATAIRKFLYGPGYQTPDPDTTGYVHATDLQLGRPCRAAKRELDNVDVLMFWAQTDRHLAPNPRASAICTPLDMRSPTPNLIAVDGPKVLVRGDAVVVRVATVMAAVPGRPPGPDGHAARGIKQCCRLPLRDFGVKDYEARWGIFSMFKVGDAFGEHEAMCICVADDDDGRKMMADAGEAISKMRR
jgi:hypothetical protein